MSRTLRAVIVGDLRYNSEFIFGVHQGLTLLGHWATVMDVHSDIGAIAKKFKDVRPDVAFMHMLMWSPMGAKHTEDLLALCSSWRQRGTRIAIHDGDARVATRHPHDVSFAVDLVLCNHTADRSAWRVRCLRWPYFAFVQREIAEPRPEFRCDLFFAGRQGGGIYADRTTLISALKQRLGDRFRVYPTQEVPHTLFLTPEIAASATAVLGHGRSREEAPGWKDVRYWQYPGAGGVLLHDDVTGPLVPYDHFIPYAPGDVDSILSGLEAAKSDGARIRRAAFRYVQERHTSVNRVGEALAALGLA